MRRSDGDDITVMIDIARHDVVATTVDDLICLFEAVVVTLLRAYEFARRGSEEELNMWSTVVALPARALG